MGFNWDFLGFVRFLRILGDFLGIFKRFLLGILGILLGFLRDFVRFFWADWDFLGFRGF